ncbi:hypothetical protein MHY_07750 [Megamonas hypermegale ART12/1]|nr:hypothetical protein MHY_07750 [Megamonas hypermegale ART12/1]
MIATIPFDKELLNPKKYANTDRALYFDMSVEYDNVNSKDKKLDTGVVLHIPFL